MDRNRSQQNKIANSCELSSYQIRGFSLYGFINCNAFVDFLLDQKEVRAGMLIAINAEKVLTAERNRVMRELITQAEFNYPDGISIVHAIHKKYPGKRIERIAGADLWQALMERAGRNHIPVFLIGGKAEVLRITCDKLRNLWNVNIVGAQDGYFSPEQREELFAQVARSGAKIVTVAMGSPRQELIMRDCRQVWPQALYMGVGGSYDVFAGVVKRAPKIWQDLGLEWLYRLIKQPSRLPRQIRLLRFFRYYWRGDL